MSPSEPHSENTGTPPLLRFPRRKLALLAGGAVAVLVVGAAAGGAGAKLAQRWQPRPVLLLQVASIDQMQPDNPVAVKGQVAEIFGNEFIIQDENGRALVDLGPRGENTNVVTKGEVVTVQGRFDRGVIRAQLVVHGDGRTEAFGPPPRPDHGPNAPPPPPRDRGAALAPPPPDPPR